MNIKSKFKEHLFISYVVPVLKFLGFNADWSQVKEHHGNFHINIGDRKNWVATLKFDDRLVQQIIIMALYDGDFATDAFAVKNIFDNDSNPIILDMYDLDPTLFPSYDNPNYDYITITCDLKRKN